MSRSDPRPFPGNARQQAIPAFALYGETGAPGLERLHIEEIQWRSSLYQWEIDLHVHRGLYQVIWVAQGRAEVSLDEWRGEAVGPVAIIAPPGVVHGFRFAPGTVGMVLTLSAHFLVEGELEAVGESLRELFKGPRLAGFDEDPVTAARLDGLMRQLCDEFSSPGSNDSPVIRWLAQAVVWRLAQGCARNALAGSGSRARHHQALFTRFVLLVEENFLRHWPVSRYADLLGLSVPRLNRLTRSEGGRAALELIHERLTREACRRLVYIAAPVAVLATELGFEDPAYFCRFFKRRTGMSPTDYRNANG